MDSIRVMRGDATAPDADGPRIIAHVCNDGGGWGKGFVLAISQRWPAPEAAFRRWFRERDRNDYALGAVQLVAVATDAWVANMVAQHGTRATREGPPIRYEAVDACLAKLGDAAVARGASVHMPRIGCGLAGGTWDRIEPLVLQRLCARDVAVTVYDFAG